MECFYQFYQSALNANKNEILISAIYIAEDFLFQYAVVDLHTVCIGYRVTGYNDLLGVMIRLAKYKIEELSGVSFTFSPSRFYASGCISILYATASCGMQVHIGAGEIEVQGSECMVEERSAG